MAPPRTPSDVIQRARAVVDYQFPPRNDFDLLPVIATRIIQTRLRQLLEGIDPVDDWRKVNLEWIEKLDLCTRIWGEYRGYRKMMFELARFLRADRDSIAEVEREDVFVKRYDVVSKVLKNVEIVVEHFGDDDVMDESFDPMSD